MAWNICLIFFVLFFQPAQAQEAIPDSVNVVVKEEVKDGPYYQLLAKRTSSPVKSLEFLEKALSARTEKQDNNWIAAIHTNMASSLFDLNKSKEAFSELLTAEKMYKQTGNFSARGEVLATMAGFYARNKALQEAEKYYQEAFALQQLANEPRLAATIALNLADICLENNELSKAVKNLIYSKNQFDKLEDNNGIATAYVKLAEVYRRQKNYSKAEQLILKSSLPLFRSTGYKAGRIDCFHVLGKIYHSQRRYSEAKWFFIQENTQARALNDKESIAISLIYLSKVKIDIGDYNLARRDLKEAEGLAKKINNLSLLANVKNVYAMLYRRSGNNSGAMYAAGRSVNLSDSLNRYYSAQAESARLARVKPEPVKTPQLPGLPAATQVDVFFIIKIISFALVILLIILIILRRIK